MTSKILISTFLLNLILAFSLIAKTPTTVSTFEVISIYWSPNSEATNLKVLVKFREEGATDWNDGLPMIYSNIGGTTNEVSPYRGSIVNLNSNTNYEIELTLEGTSETETIIAKTWNEDFPISDTITSFTRKMISFKVGIGNRNNYFDFIVLRAADDSTSINPSVKETGKFPATNLVTGINTHLALTPTLYFEAEAAYSVYTENQNSVITFESPDFVNKVIPVNLSSKFFLAVRALLEYKNKKGLKFSLKYRRIDPGYKSMGSYFINNDLENITFNTGFAALKRKLRFNGSIGLERNNLKAARNATTKKVIGSAMVSYDPIRQFGITFNYSNYSVNQQAGRIQIADSVKLYQTNGTIMIMPHVQLMSKDNKLSHFFSLVFTRMNLNDKNIYTGNNNSFTTINNMINYTVSVIPIGLSVTTAFNYNKVNMSIGNSTNTGGSIGISKSFLKNKITTGFNTNITQSKNEQQTYLVFNTGLNGRIRLGKRHQFRIKISFISSKDKTNSVQNSNEQIGDLSYVFTF